MPSSRIQDELRGWTQVHDLNHSLRSVHRDMRAAADRIDALEELVRFGIAAVIDLDGCPGYCGTEGQCFTFRARKALGEDAREALGDSG